MSPFVEMLNERVTVLNLFFQFLVTHRTTPQTEVATVMDFLDTKFLFASLVWGAIGSGYIVYGRRNGEHTCLFGGLTMVAVSFLIGSWFWMSLISIALLYGIHWMMKRG